MAEPEVPTESPVRPTAPVEGGRGRWRAALRRWYPHAPLLATLALCAAYVAYWFSLALDRYYSLNAAVYDLGIEMQGGWVFTQSGGWSSPLNYVESALYTPTRFLLSPVTATANYPALLLLQTVALASGAVAVYAIARFHIGGRLAPVLFAGAYLVYPSLAGLNWFDFHWEALFVPLFLFGYLCFLHARYRTALLLFAVGGLTTFPYIVMPGLFGALVGLEAVWPRLAQRGPVDRVRLRFGLLLVVVSVAFLLYQAANLSSFDVHQFLDLIAFRTTTHSTGGYPPLVLSNRALVMAIVLGPVIALPIFSPKWLVLLAPYAYLVLGSNYWAYDFPTILQTQYGALVIPIVFAASLEVLGRASRPPEPRSAPAPTGRPLRRTVSRLSRLPWKLPVRMTPRRALGVAATIAVLGLLLALVFQPYGPLNQVGPESFPVAATQHANLTLFHELSTLIGLIPRSNPYVLFQNDMPEALPRVLDYLQTPLVSSEIDWLNISVWDAIHDQFPLELFNGEVVQAQISYLIDNPQGPLFFAYATPGISMYYFVRAVYESGQYGVMGEASGMLLLQRGYLGPLVYYVPYEANFSARQLWSWSTGAPSLSAPITRSNFTNGRLWWGPYATLSPGGYEATIWLRSSDLSASNVLPVRITAEDGAVALASANISGTDFSATNTWQAFEIPFFLNDTMEDVQVATQNASWSGTISVDAVQLGQVSPAVNPLG